MGWGGTERGAGIVPDFSKTLYDEEKVDTKHLNHIFEQARITASKEAKVKA